MDPLDEIEQTAKLLLAERKAAIQDGKLNGRHWFVAVFQEAQDTVRRRRAWKARTRT